MVLRFPIEVGFVKLLDALRKAISMKPEDIKRKPPCLKCGLKSAYSAEVVFYRHGFELPEATIKYELCKRCFDEANERYNPNYTTSLLEAEIFESVGKC